MSVMKLKKPGMYPTPIPSHPKRFDDGNNSDQAFVFSIQKSISGALRIKLKIPLRTTILITRRSFLLSSSSLFLSSSDCAKFPVSAEVVVETLVNVKKR
jgi:hypothetical protein